MIILISTEQMRVKAQGDGSNKRFTFPFVLNKATDLLVRTWDGENLVTVTDWTIEPVGGVYPTTGGTLVYPASANPVTSDITVIIERNIAIIQNDGYKRNDSLSMTSLEKTFDTCVQQIQDVHDDVSRAVYLPVECDYEDISTRLPIPKPNMGFYWDETGTKLVEGLNPKEATEQAAMSAAQSGQYAADSKASADRAEELAVKVYEGIDEAKQAAENAKTSELAAAESAELAGEHADDAAKSADEARQSAIKTRQPIVFKGGVETYGELPTNPDVGDYYHIVNADEAHGINAGDCVAWDGTQWVNMGNIEGVAIATDPEIIALFSGVIPEPEPEPEHSIATDPEIRALF